MDYLSEYKRIRKQSLTICEPLTTEDYVVQPADVASPPKWHLAHITWFFETFILRKFYPNYRPFDEQYIYLFNSYYESVGEHFFRPNRGHLSRPTVSEIKEYRKYVDSYMQELLAKANLSDELKNLIEIGLNHEQQHQELLFMDIKYILGHNPTFPAYSDESLLKSLTSTDQILNIPEGVYEIGYNGDGFCYDNERNRHKVYLNSYQIHSKPVTNGEYLKFVEANGYQSFQYWHSDGWTWVNENHITAPEYWFKKDGKWMEYTLNGLHPLNLDAPVCHVSYYEAYAFVEWAEKRLPTEAEWEIAAEQLDRGHCWDWTESSYLPYPGYEKPAGAIGEYNAKFMVSQMVLRGGCVATPEGHARDTYRNFFYPNNRWQFSGIRLCEK